MTWDLLELLHNSRHSVGDIVTYRTLYLIAEMPAPLHMYIKIVHGEIGWGGMNWIDLAQDRNLWRTFVHTVMNLRVP
jgi:hypothetical protein